jgi:Family of unknown function (DUF5998)
MVASSTSHADQLDAALQRTGYYPEVVAQALHSAAAGELILSFYVHHEPTFDHEEVRRHQTVAVLTPTRLILAHTDEHAGDHMVPTPYTSTATEAIALSGIKSVMVTRISPTPHTAAREPTEIFVAVSWGGVSRIDLEPAACGDPDCEADHGFTGVLARDDFSLRVSEAADGPEAVLGLLRFAQALSEHTRG